MRVIYLITFSVLATLVLIAFRSEENPLLGTVLHGKASYYGPGFHNKLTANGEIYDQNALTCAHKSLAFGTMLRLKNLENGREITVRVNDRGPFIIGRVFDVSMEGARRLDMIQKGVVNLEAEIIGINGQVQNEIFIEWLKYLKLKEQEESGAYN